MNSQLQGTSVCTGTFGDGHWWLFLGSVQEFCRKVPGKLRENCWKHFPESRNATNSRIPGTGKGKPAGNLGSTLPGPCPNLPCGVFFEIDSSSLLEFFWKFGVVNWIWCFSSLRLPLALLPWKPIPPKFGGWRFHPPKIREWSPKITVKQVIFWDSPPKFGGGNLHPPNLGGGVWVLRVWAKWISSMWDGCLIVLASIGHNDSQEGALHGTGMKKLPLPAFEVWVLTDRTATSTPTPRLLWGYFNSVQTRCIVKGEAQKSPLFWRFSGGFWFSQDRLLSRNSTRKPFKFNKIPDFYKHPLLIHLFLQCT